MKAIEILARGIAGPNWDRLSDNPNSQHEYVSDAGAAIRFLEEHGFVIVPKNPTINMIMAGHEFCRRDPSCSMDSATRCYGAMIQKAQH